MTTIPVTQWLESSFHVNVTRQDFEAHDVAVIEREVCDAYGLAHRARKVLHRRTRKQEIAWPRMVAIYLFRGTLGMGLQSAADHFGLSDCSSAHHAVQAVVERMETCPREKAKIAGLMDALEGRKQRKNWKLTP